MQANYEEKLGQVAARGKIYGWVRQGLAMLGLLSGDYGIWQQPAVEPWSGRTSSRRGRARPKQTRGGACQLHVLALVLARFATRRAVSREAIRHAISVYTKAGESREERT